MPREVAAVAAIAPPLGESATRVPALVETRVTLLVRERQTLVPVVVVEVHTFWMAPAITPAGTVVRGSS